MEHLGRIFYVRTPKNVRYLADGFRCADRLRSVILILQVVSVHMLRLGPIEWLGYANKIA